MIPGGMNSRQLFGCKIRGPFFCWAPRPIATAEGWSIGTDVDWITGMLDISPRNQDLDGTSHRCEEIRDIPTQSFVQILVLNAKIQTVVGWCPNRWYPIWMWWLWQFGVENLCGQSTVTLNSDPIFGETASCRVVEDIDVLVSRCPNTCRRWTPTTG